MSVNYTDLNKHCPKDPFGLPRIDQSSTPRRAATCSASSTATLGTTRLLSRKKTRRRPCSSPRLALPTSELSRPASRGSSTRTSKPMWMTWSSRPKTPSHSSSI
jgi:hypothetical protein